ncbi:hypothetical protein P9239_13435 [Caballeronia sp. LZ062]|uniref:hypothetical protein n=1 Tax=unclassified Caballeronia TaxID=2646786 RepID=UPI00285EB132|nr:MULTISPECIES: hypothetical protein [unclassified Caballeronia]MDR5854123.1 hypothetical protein [Caballeronia sp. LZ050]MDR5871346.1 hypothetical protein [Caballeronia sp. LZ062]
MSTKELDSPASRFADESRAGPADARRRGMSTSNMNVQASRVAAESAALDRLMSGGAA